MINFIRTELVEINEKDLFENLKEFLLEDEIFSTSNDYLGLVEKLPKEVQRLIFAKIGAMMIDYAGSEEF